MAKQSKQESDEGATQKRVKRPKHPGHIEDRGDYLRVILRCGGERYTYRLDTKDRKAAEKFAREEMRRLQDQLDVKLDRRRQGLPDVVPFSALLEQYKRDELPTLSPGTQRSYADSFLPIAQYFVDTLGDPTLDHIQAKQVKGFLAWRRLHRRAGKHQTASTEPVSNRTLQKDRAVLHRLFDFADQYELREGNPVARVDAPNADPRTPILLSDEQYDGLLAKCADNPMLSLYVLVLGETGGRCVSEALHLRFEDVDLAEGFIQIRSGRDGHRTKSGKSRYVPMTPRLAEAMKAHFARYRFAGSPWVFHHERDRRGCKAGQRVKSMRTAFDTAQQAAGIPDAFHRHDLRHRRVTTWLAAGGNPTHVKEAMGHSDLRTTMGYTHLSKEHLKGLATLGTPGNVAPQTDANTQKSAQNAS